MTNQSNQTEGPATNTNRREGTASGRRALSLVVSPPQRVITVPAAGRESVNDHGFRAVGRYGSGCAACGDQELADRGAAHWRTRAGQGLGELAEGAVGQRST